ncbi:ATP-grasp domain-containing protein [candidate division CSSED10-310 bacterium]|uniref:ATP-grasp domain-containing protein n=1 Tax=candidate division CSSED10-310 bacterium TaxID=2855610 RepID=A0ABV6YXC2_UNCC1
MKVAVIYNRESMKVINLIGALNPEKYRVEAIKRITKTLKASGHQVKIFEGDKHLIERLEEFMPAVVKGERPGMALNLAYGIQGFARYTHVPGILEMVGIPYVGSGPLAHSLSLDKVVAKMLFKQNGLPTPDFKVLETPAFEAPDLSYPLIVKPKSGADSFGLMVVNDEKELREAARPLFDKYTEPVLAECYIEGREINIGLIGNPPEAFPPVELDFGDGSHVYTNDDKGGRSGRTVHYICPAKLDQETTKKAQEIACKAFTTLQCSDCARVDMRIGEDGSLYLLELNSLPSLGYRGSFVVGAENAGLDFAALLNRLLDSASRRYFGVPMLPPQAARTRKGDGMLAFLTANRDKLEHLVEELISHSARTSDPIGTRKLVKHLDKRYQGFGLLPVKDLTDKHVISTWETPEGMKGGTLIVVQVDSLLGGEIPYQAFRRTPEWLHGEAVGESRAPLAMLEYALRALRTQKKLRGQRIGILVYADEGRDCRYSRKSIELAARIARRVIVLRSGSVGGNIVVGSRGLRKFQLLVEDVPRDFRPATKSPDVLRWINNRMEAMMQLSSRKDRIGVFVTDIRAKHFPTMLPHHVQITLLVSYPKPAIAEQVEEKIRDILGKTNPKWQLNLISDRPAMPVRNANRAFFEDVKKVAIELDIPLSHETSAMPSVAGLVPEGVAVICGLSPAVDRPNTPHEAVQRISLFQRTILLTEVLQREVV